MPLAALRRHRAEIMGLAILWIMLYHADVVLPGPLHPLMFFKFVGYGAVDLFFLLSGFGLAYGRAAAHPGLGAFVVRRLRRIAPAYLVVATAWALAALAPRGQLTPGSYLELVTGLNFLVRRDAVFWFVPAIVVAYATFPAVRTLVAEGRVGRNVAAVIGLTLCCLAGSSVLAHLDLGEYLLLTERLPEFVLGAALGAWLRRSPEATLPRAAVLTFLALGAATVVVVTRYASPEARFALGLRFYPFLLVSLPLALTLAWGLDAWAALEERRAPLTWPRRALAFCGTHSLELYLGHVLLFELAPLGPDGRWPWPAAWTPGRLPEFGLYALAALLAAVPLRRLSEAKSPASSSPA